MSRFIPTDRDTAYLLPPSMDEWLTNDHLARFVVNVMEQLDLSELIRHYAVRSSAAHNPAALLGLQTYDYANSAHSSRKAVRATRTRWCVCSVSNDHCEVFATVKKYEVDA